MQVRVEQLKGRSRTISVDEPLSAFTMLSELNAEGVTTFSGNLTGEVVAFQADDLVEVEGSLEVSIVQPCSRCLQPVAQRLALSVAWSYVREPAAPAAEAAEIELSEEAIGLIPFSGDEIDLHNAAEQEVLMALPQHPLCREDCSGLCPVCGADRNRDRCSCTPPVFHGGFAALQGFHAKKD